MSSRLEKKIGSRKGRKSVKDAESASDALLELTESDRAVDRGRLEIEMAELMDWYVDRRPGELEL